MKWCVLCMLAHILSCISLSQPAMHAWGKTVKFLEENLK